MAKGPHVCGSLWGQCVTQELIASCDQRNNLCVTEEIKPNGNLDPKVSNLVSVGVGSSHKGDGDNNHYHQYHPDGVHGQNHLDNVHGQNHDDNDATQVELLWW